MVIRKISEITSSTLRLVPGVYSKLGRTKQQRSFRVALIVGIVLAFLTGNHFYGRYNELFAYNAFANSVNQENTTEALVNLEKIRRLVKRKYSSYNASGSLYLPSSEDRHVFLESLIKVIKQFKNEEYLEGIKALKSIRATYGKVTFNSNTQNLKFSKLIREGFKDFVDKYKNYRRKEITYPPAIEENNNRIFQQGILAQDLANEFGALMSLNPINIQASKDQSKFYNDGILKGLPILQGLPDGVTDLNELKQILNETGGKVTIRGSNTPELFKKKIAELKKDCEVFGQQIIQLQSENQKMMEELQSSKTEFYAAVLGFQEAIKELLIIYVTP